MTQVYVINCSPVPLINGAYGLEQINGLLKGSDSSNGEILFAVFNLHLSAFIDRQGLTINTLNYLGNKYSEEINESIYGIAGDLSIDGSRDNEAVSAAIVAGLNVGILTNNVESGFQAMIMYLSYHFNERFETDVYTLALAKLMRQFGRYNKSFTVFLGRHGDDSFDLFLESDIDGLSSVQINWDIVEFLALFSSVGISTEMIWVTRKIDNSDHICGLDCDRFDCDVNLITKSRLSVPKPIVDDLFTLAGVKLPGRSSMSPQVADPHGTSDRLLCKVCHESDCLGDCNA